MYIMIPFTDTALRYYLSLKQRRQYRYAVHKNTQIIEISTNYAMQAGPRGTEAQNVKILLTVLWY